MTSDIGIDLTVVNFILFGLAALAIALGGVLGLRWLRHWLLEDPSRRREPDDR